MGTKRDTKQRQNFRQDNSQIWDKIITMRKWIFEKGYGVGSKMVGRLLDPTSLLPTRVSLQFHRCILQLIDGEFFRVLFLLGYLHSVSIFTPCLFPTSFMNLSSVSGVPYLRISFAFSTLWLVPGHSRGAICSVPYTSPFSLTPFYYTGSGWGNIWQEILLNAYLSYKTNRAYVSS